MVEFSDFSVYPVRYQIKISDMRFATEQLPVALYQSRTQFLSGTGLDKLKKSENSTTIRVISCVKDVMRKLQKLSSYQIKDQELFEQIFTHKSWTKSKTNNERLEFLGDAVLNLIVADLLMEKYPQSDEGDLTKRRSQLVSGQTLAKKAEELDFPEYLKAGSQSYTKNPRILAGALEAYIGAVYLEGGVLSAKGLISHLFQKMIDQNAPELNYKSVLQEWCQKKYKEPPMYKLSKEEGQDHKKTFFVYVFIQNECYGKGSSYQKKQAEQEAAKEALKRLNISLEN